MLEAHSPVGEKDNNSSNISGNSCSSTGNSDRLLSAWCVLITLHTWSHLILTINIIHYFIHSTKQNKSDQVLLLLEQSFLHWGRRRIKGVVSWKPSKESFSRNREWKAISNADGRSSKMKTATRSLQLTKWMSRVTFIRKEWWQRKPD